MYRSRILDNFYLQENKCYACTLRLYDFDLSKQTFRGCISGHNLYVSEVQRGEIKACRYVCHCGQSITTIEINNLAAQIL